MVNRTRAQRVRLDEAGPELECRWCDEYWPLTREYWNVRRDGGVEADRCRPCERERNRLRYVLLQHDPDYREGARQRARRYRYYIRRQHPHLAAAYQRERTAIEREYQRQRRAA
jgi:hypothetical protein